MAGVPVVCGLCGVSADDVDLPLSWTTSVEAGVTRHYCDRCTRANVRAIESKLDTAWW